jgi:hypothetical protein
LRGYSIESEQQNAVAEEVVVTLDAVQMPFQQALPSERCQQSGGKSSTQDR